MELHGKNILGGETSGLKGRTFAAVDPATGAPLQPLFHQATEREVSCAAELAGAAFVQYARVTPQDRAAFLEAIGAGIMALGDELIARARAETGLPETRLAGERARTVNQLAMFAQLVREGSWVHARIDRAQPQRKPLPRPDLRRMLAPLGPVAVFGASNFPLAFSVAGGDTASALAAGNSVVIKAHPSHPGTSELVMRALQAAVGKCGMPVGVVSLVHGTGNAVGLALVRHPALRAVAFTGSLRGARALCRAAASRTQPIPVYAEMGSTNPVFVLPGALVARGAEIAQGLVQSVTLGVGQFCTNPGLVFGVAGPDFQAFAARVAQLIAQVPPGTMLNAGIRARYVEDVEAFGKAPGVRVAGAAGSADPRRTQASAIVFITDARTFLNTPCLHEELFGPATLLVACESLSALQDAARSLHGQLTATMHGTAEDFAEGRALLDLLARKAGRIICNGFPTGVEVCAAMHHGGPWPAASNPLHTSVGTAAILRFAQPVCYQDFPQELLPPELRDRNERGIWRLVEGELTKADVSSP